MSKSLKETYFNGESVKAWKNKAGISLGIQKDGDERANPFLSFYSRTSGGYVLIIKREVLEDNKILLEIE